MNKAQAEAPSIADCAKQNLVGGAEVAWPHARLAPMNQWAFMLDRRLGPDEKRKLAENFKGVS